MDFGTQASPPNPHHNTYANYRHTNTSTDSIPLPHETSSIPLSLQAQQLTLEESKTYMRWYSDILARTNSRTVSISDVYQFLSNFKISPAIKEKTNRIFAKLLHSLNIGEFFALLRIVSHALQGKEPQRSLIAVKTRVPTPPSILSKKRLQDEPEEDEEPPTNPPAALDLDSFTQFMLTGQRPDDKPKKRSKKLKSVKFSDQIVTDIKTDAASYDHHESQDYLSMDQLMDRMKASPPNAEEKKLLKEMEPQINHFQNLNSVDTISVDGVPSSIHLNNPGFSSPRDLSPQPLQPNMTGPAQMASMGYSKPARDWNAPLQPNVTGPADMARLLSPSEPAISLQSFSDQMTGKTLENTHQNSGIGQSTSLQNQPTPAASLNWGVPSSSANLAPQVPSRRTRSVSSPSPMPIDNHHNEERISSPGPPVPPRITERSPRPVPPPPRSRRTAGSFSRPSEPGPPLPEKVPHSVYQNSESSSSTANILDDLQALQEEVDRIRDMSGGF